MNNGQNFDKFNETLKFVNPRITVKKKEEEKEMKKYTTIPMDITIKFLKTSNKQTNKKCLNIAKGRKTHCILRKKEG